MQTNHQLKVVSSRELMQSTGVDLEILFVPRALLGKSPRELSGARELWSDDRAIEQFKRREKEISDDKSKPESQAICTVFSSGSFSQIHFLTSGLKTSELQRKIRLALAEPLKERLALEKGAKVILDVSQLDETDQARCIEAVAFLAQTVRWEPECFGKKKSKKSKEKKSGRVDFLVRSELKESEQVWNRGQMLGAANNEVRTLAELPANELHPGTYREHIRDYCSEHGLEYDFWDIKKLEKEKAGAFLAVTRADPKSQGGIACIRYRPRGAGKAKGKGAKSSNGESLALVGKGLCFDTGGYNVKTGSYMLGMHGDMTGSAIALALCGYFAKIKAPFEVRAYLALAENLISPTGYKPNEVVVACDGTSIEVVDTDAEGRMVLSDTLALVRRTKPTLTLDFATLTGAAPRAIGTQRGSVFSNSEDLLALAYDAGEESGERVWGFPIGDEYRRGLDSKVADIMQCSSDNHCDHLYAATFLSHFIGEENPWIHLDLSSSENKEGLGLVTTNTTGFGVLWAEALVRRVLG